MTSYLYEAMTGYGQALDRFWSRIGTTDNLDLVKDDHRRALLKFLNDWGCRNLAVAWHSLALAELDSWYEATRERIDAFDGPTFEAQNRRDLIEVYDDLSGRIIAHRKSKGGELSISFGPTATSKTLFVLRPELFPAWDGAIRTKLGHQDDGESYVEFVEHAHHQIRGLNRLAESSGFAIESLPQMLGRPSYTTLVQLVGEYYWITLTRSVSLRSRDEVTTWTSWSAASD